MLDERELDGRGRGFVAVADVVAGTTLFCERATVSEELRGTDVTDEDEACDRAARLWLGATRVEGGASVLARLEPRTQVHEGLTVRAGPLSAAAARLATSSGMEASSPVAKAGMLKMLLNTAEVQIGKRSFVGLFPQLAVLNHADFPNAAHLGTEVGEGNVGVKVVAVRDIAAGDEVLINYLPDAAGMSPEERQEYLESQYHFRNVPCIPTDAELAHVADESRLTEELARTLRALNAAGAQAWDEAEALRKDAAATAAAPEVRAKRMAAAEHYAKLLSASEGVLGRGHRWRLNAMSRLALVMAATGAARSCANAVAFWKELVPRRERAVPELWPALAALYRVAAEAARVAEDADAAKTWLAKLDNLERKLKLSSH